VKTSTSLDGKVGDVRERITNNLKALRIRQASIGEYARSIRRVSAAHAQCPYSQKTGPTEKPVTWSASVVVPETAHYQFADGPLWRGRGPEGQGAVMDWARMLA